MCTTTGETYTTNNSGSIEGTIYASSNSIEFSMTSISSTLTDGSLTRTNTTTYNIPPVDGKIEAITNSNVIVTPTTRASGVINVSAVEGASVTISGNEYTIVYVDDSVVYVVLKTCQKNVQWDAERGVYYPTSTLCQTCETWYNSISDIWRSANVFTTTNVSDAYYQNCFVFSTEQINSFQYFDDLANRVDGRGTEWWTSTAIKAGETRAFTIKFNGSSGNSDTTNSHGFRPALAIYRSRFVS